MAFSTSSNARPLVPALAGLWEALFPYAYPVVRVTVGGFMIPHGMVMLFTWGGAPGIEGFAPRFEAIGLSPGVFWATAAGAINFFGGIALVLGLLTRLAAALGIGVMAVSTFYVHWSNGFSWMAQGFEYPLFWGLVLIAVLIRGGGWLSLDARIGREL